MYPNIISKESLCFCNGNFLLKETPGEEIIKMFGSHTRLEKSEIATWHQKCQNAVD